MKSFVLILFFLPLLAIGQNQASIHWTTWDKVEAQMEKEPRKVMVDVYTSWCGPCRMMSQNTFTDPEVVKYINENYYAIKFDAEGPDSVAFKGTTYKNDQYDPSRSGRNATHDLAKAIAPVQGRIAYPTIVYMDEDFKILTPVQGYLQPAQIMPILKFFASNAYKTQTWEEYSGSK